MFYLKKQLPLLPLTTLTTLTTLLLLDLDLCFENLGHKASFGLAEGQGSLFRPGDDHRDYDEKDIFLEVILASLFHFVLFVVFFFQRHLFDFC